MARPDLDLGRIPWAGNGLPSPVVPTGVNIGTGLSGSYDVGTGILTISVSSSGPQWHTLFDTDFGTIDPVVFDHDGQYILSDQSIWYKAGTALDVFNPQAIAAAGLRWWPMNTHDIRVGSGVGPCLYTRNADLGLMLDPTTPFRLDFMRGNGANPSANWVSADALLEVSRPGGLEPQRQCNWIQASLNGPVAYPGSYMNWTGGNRYNNGVPAIYWSEIIASGMVALDCARLTMTRGAVPGHVLHLLGASVAGEWPAENRWTTSTVGDDWGGALRFANTYTDLLTRGTFNGWGICLGALRGFPGADPNCYVDHRRIRLQAYY